MSDAQKLIAEVIAEHRGTVSCVGPDAWESYCDCEWSSDYFYEGGAEDEAQWEHDAHVAAEVDKALGGLTRKKAVVRDYPDNEGEPKSRWVSGWTVTE